MKNKFLIANLLLILLIQNAFSQQNISLSGQWKVIWSGGNAFSKDTSTFIHSDPLSDSIRYLPVDVPMDLNLAMEKKGIINDINFGINTLSANWIGEQYWKYYRYFTVPDQAKGKELFLVFEQLDYNATIMLNGEVIGTHKNAYTPCRINVTNKVKTGKNLLVVAIESGFYDVIDKEGAGFSTEITSLSSKRQWLRKPQYQFGWDSSPKLVNVGITGDVRLEWKESARLNQIATNIWMSDDLSEATLLVRPFIECFQDSSFLTIEVKMAETNQNAVIQQIFNKSNTHVDLTFKVKNPELWWPRGYGNQKLYSLTVSIKKNGQIIDSASCRIGFRKFEIDRSKHPQAGNYFTFKVNNQKIFIKGGNYVPTDLIFSSLNHDRLRQTLDLAVKANFNFLRIWGGGEYVGNDFLDLCDENGILVWHDFPFACIIYPGDNIDFYNNVKEETTWAVREFSHHPSLALWCGSNENELFTGGYVTRGKVVPDYIIYHYMLPQIIKYENPEKIYWPSSPYSENLENPNSPYFGDQHPWSVSLNFMGSDGPNFYGYRNHQDRFASEGGFMGASNIKTLQQFLPKNQQYVHSISWDHHDNAFWKPENMTYWFGKNYDQMSFEDYVFASGVIQAEALSEYINNYHRRMFSSSGAVFWMYKDGWPASHSWSIVDYYNRKKPAYYSVKRAFNQINVVVVKEGDKINIYGINDMPTVWKGKLQYGVFKMAGDFLLNKDLEVSLPGDSSVIIASFDAQIYLNSDLNSNGAFAVLTDKDGCSVSQNKLLLSKFQNLQVKKPAINIRYMNGYAILTSPVYVWAVNLNKDGESSIFDNCFDLIPGIPYYIKQNNIDKFIVEDTGNSLLLRIKNYKNEKN